MATNPSIPSVLKAARAASAADARRRFVTTGGYIVAGAFGAAAIGVGVTSLLVEAPGWWLIPVGAGAASVAVAGFIAWLRRCPIAQAAGEVDRANGTEGALRTAIEINDRDGEPSLVALARSRGERVAASVDPKRGIAPPDHRGWWWSIPALGACVAFGLLLDPIDRTPKRPDPSPMIARALGETEPGLQEARAVEPESLPDPEKWAETMAEIEALEEELRRGDAAEDAPTRAAAAMEQAAEELERQAELAAREEQAIRDRAEAYRTDEATEPSRLAQRLADALARNDMDAAEEAARELDRASESLTEEELRALADTLEDMASRLDDPSAMPQEPPGHQTDPSETPPSPTDPAGQLDQPETPPPEQTPEVSPPPTQEPQTQERLNSDSLPEALRRQAESLREPPPNPEQQDPSQQDTNQDQSQQPNEQPQGGQPGEQPEPQPGRESGEQTGERPSADPNQQQPQSQPSQDPNQQGQPESSQQGELQQGQSRQEQPEPGQEQQGSQQQTQEQQGQQQQGQQEQGQQEQGQPQQGSEQGTQPQPGEQPSQQSTQQPTQQPGQPQPGEQPGGQPQPQPTGQPGEQTQQQPGQQPQEVPTPNPGGQPQGTSRPDPNAPPGSIERAVERLREQQDARQRNRQVAESLRDRARGLMDDPSLPPGDGGAGSEDAPLAQDNPLTDDPSRYEPVDASGQVPAEPDSGRVVGEWFDPNREDLPPSERAAAAGEMRRAVRKARDAMDNQQVPRRYRDLVRRVFDRVERRAEEVAPGPAPQGQDAQP